MAHPDDAPMAAWSPERGWYSATPAEHAELQAETVRRLTMPEWRRRSLASADHPFEAAHDTTGSVAL